jgi:uncharacterized protein
VKKLRKSKHECALQNKKAQAGGALGLICDDYGIGTVHLATVRHGDLLVAELFSYLHDSQRENEWTDPGHGERAAEYAVSLNTRFFDLAPSQLDLLTNAMRFHSDGELHMNATIQSCWDADRLDLGRVGKRPHRKYLSEYAHPLIEDAYEWSIG